MVDGILIIFWQIPTCQRCEEFKCMSKDEVIYEISSNTMSTKSISILVFSVHFFPIKNCIEQAVFHTTIMLHVGLW